MLEQGMAAFLCYQKSSPKAKEYQIIETAAKNAEKGIWSDIGIFNLELSVIALFLKLTILNF